MTRTTIAIVALILIVLFGVVIFRYRSSQLVTAPTAPIANPVATPPIVTPPTETTETAVPPVTAISSAGGAATKVAAVPVTIQPASHRIVISAEGFTPASLTVRRGDNVTFVNNDTEPHWPASNPHPAHTGCSGFDADHGLAPNETYQLNYSFDQACGYHDHLHPRLRGQLELAQ